MIFRRLRQSSGVVGPPPSMRPATPVPSMNRGASRSVATRSIPAAPIRQSLIRVDAPRDLLSPCGHDDCPCASLAPRAS